MSGPAPILAGDGGLALSQPRADTARGGRRVLAASSLGRCLVFVSGTMVSVVLAATGQEMRRSPLQLQWVMSAELPPLAALSLATGLGERISQKRILPIFRPPPQH